MSTVSPHAPLPSVGGLRSIGYIVLLLFLIFYLFAIAGITLFRENDPYHWRDVGTALMTLFRAATLEDWTDVMYIGIYGRLAHLAITTTDDRV